jgi:hypothetical protein
MSFQGNGNVMNVMGIWEGIKQTMIMMADDWNQRCGHKLGHLPLLEIYPDQILVQSPCCLAEILVEMIVACLLFIKITFC